MDLKQLRALVTVAEAGSVTRAAELLHLVQPAVTRQIRTLEQELGVILFERTRQGMQPTAAGTTMVERARRALNELERARAEIRPAAGVVTGIVTVGLLDSATGLLAEPLASAVLRDHPGIDLRLLTAYSGHLQQWLDDGDLDLTLLYNLASTPSLNAEPLVRERLWAVAPASAGLRADRPVPLREAVAHPLVVPASGHGLRSVIDAAATQARVEMNLVVQTNSMHVQKQLVRAGHGWTILPGVGIAQDVADGSLSAAPLCDPEVWRSIVLGTPRAGRVSPATRAVASELTDRIRSAVREGRWPSAELQDRAVKDT
ncbi:MULTISPECIES: LysR family transcriptional regulator [Streptomyces]|uniref:LysR family transcriptional regulator n=2 Tax=Streptomyces TaxID=1883 RepID=A0ABX6BPN1_9ACTN|nr:MULTISPECIES: LysR family transcriptional regulator [Streptomyces]AVH94206.1 LysR family transcriptional regulator [Streptomyces sp. WAC00288]KYG51371.1 LysR family transcriptional regulator [Streptomyces sp. WAC04657]MBB4158259.1 DNA-binding transcriptional LysR family regulator [Streptomyces cinereoruber]MBY8819207.1 LysR family transcriptional regulator [Streptomyces cinereoruber]NIH63392.1 DNA-binding transcriptional LysR family regulator [Streptomyces cinereoruber]